MKILLAISLLWVSTASFTIQSTPSATGQVENKIYVHARKGLVLRATAAPTGQKLEVIPYGEALEVISPKASGSTYTAETYGPYKITGKWLHVRTGKGKKGYVFEGYVSTLPILPSESNGTYFLDLFRANLSPDQTLLRESTDLADLEEGAIEGKYMQFSDGAELIVSMFEGGYGEMLRVPKDLITPEKAFVILRAAFYTGETEITSSYDEDFQALRASDFMSAILVKEQEDMLVIQFMGS